MGKTLAVRQIRVGPMANFSYFLMDERSSEGAIIDSGWETEPLVQAVEREKSSLKYIVATHGHFDHVSTIEELAGTTGAEVVAHLDSEVKATRRVAGGDSLSIGGTTVNIIHTPGHTRDSICLYDGSNLFTGDTLFVGTIGRYERESAEDMYRSLHQAILGLPEETVFYPGHDYGEVTSRTLGEERTMNPYLRASSFRDFLDVS